MFAQNKLYIKTNNNKYKLYLHFWILPIELQILILCFHGHNWRNETNWNSFGLLETVMSIIFRFMDFHISCAFLSSKYSINGWKSALQLLLVTVLMKFKMFRVTLYIHTNFQHISNTSFIKINFTSHCTFLLTYKI